MRLKKELYTYPCPCCGFITMDEEPGSYNICEICGWEDDHVQLMNPMFSGGANGESLWWAQWRVCKILPVKEFQSFRGFERSKEWRPLTVEERDKYDAQIKSGMDYFHAACETEPNYYWQK